MHYLDEGDGPRRAAAARRADLVVPLPQDHPGADAGGARDRARLLRLRPLGQAAAARGLLLRLPRRARSRGSSRSSTSATLTVVVQDWGGPIGLQARRRAPRPRSRELVDHEHRHRRRPAAVGRVAALPRLGPPRSAAEIDPRAASSRSRAVQPMSDEVDGGVQRAVAGAGVEGGRSSPSRSCVPISPDHPDTPAHLRRARGSSRTGSGRRSSSSPTPTRSSPRASPSGSRRTSRARASRRSSPARATSSRRIRAS